jgi:hypothetical protein
MRIARPQPRPCPDLSSLEVRAMECPKCKAQIPANPPKTDEAPRTPAPDDALRADRPPAPCPQCGWSTMWNE